jgi:adenine-specific DNA-methyltransferase
MVSFDLNTADQKKVKKHKNIVLHAKSLVQEKKISYGISGNYVGVYDVEFGQADALEFLKSVPDKSIKLVVTSPPYNIGKVYEKRKEFGEYLDYQRLVAKECVRILKDDGSIAWEVGNYVYKKEVYPLDYFFYKIFKEENDLKLRNRIIWRFGHGLHASLRFSGRYETILWFTKSDDYTFNLDPVRIPQKYPGKTYYKGSKKGLPSGNPLGKNPSDIWDVLIQDWEEGVWNIPNVKSNHPEKTSHPAQFPIELVQRLVLALTNEKDTVLDPFGGVGSTAIGSIMYGRKAVSIDRDQGYTQIALKRLKDYIKGNLKIRTIGTKIYAPSGKEKISKIPQSWLNESRR